MINNGISKKGSLIVLFSIFAISLFVRFGYITYLGGGAQGGDYTHKYLKESDEILKGNILSYRSSLFSTDSGLPKHTMADHPGLPIFLALTRAIFGDGFNKQLVINVVLYSLVCVLTCYLAFKSYGIHVALFTAPFIILSPAMNFWSRFVLSEALFTFLLLVSIICLYHVLFLSGSNRKVVFLSVFGGIVFGYAALTREVLFPLIICIVLWIVMLKFRRTGLRLKNSCIIIFLFTAFLTYGLWSTRNIIVLRKIDRSCKI
jgi:4-amino-4-deoxy-L-arabinose transferase-like glycosyltransferase